jgi:hypothetical protein
VDRLGHRLRSAPLSIFGVSRGAPEYLLRKSDPFVVSRPLDVARHAAGKALAVVIYFRQRTLTFKTVSDGTFVGHSGPFEVRRHRLRPAPFSFQSCS